jgi:hypothetical protein
VKPLKLLRRELAEAEAEEIEAFKNFRRWGTQWDERQWVKAMEKCRSMAQELSRKNGQKSPCRCSASEKADERVVTRKQM